MKISEVRRTTAKDQTAILRKITAARVRIATHEAKIATLSMEIEMLTAELFEVATENVSEWDGFVPTSPVAAEVRSDLNIPMPTSVVEKIRVTAYGVVSNFDEVR